MTTTRSAMYLATVSLLVALAACGGNSDSAPDETAPPPSRATTTTVDPTEPTTPEESTTTSTTEELSDTTVDTEPATTESTVAENGGGFLPDDLGRRVDSVSGVDTPGEIVELLENVWIFVPSESDPNDASVIPPLPEDREILTGYAYALGAIYEQITQDPVPGDPSDEILRWLTPEYLPRYVQSNLTSSLEAGEHQNVSGGVVLRPVVIADPRSDSEVVIFDCVLDGGDWVLSDGSLAPGETPGVTELPLSARLLLVDGEWKLDALAEDDRACA